MAIPIEFPDEALERFQEAGGRPIWDAWVASMEEKGLPGQKILDLVLTTAKGE